MSSIAGHIERAPTDLATFKLRGVLAFVGVLATAAGCLGLTSEVAFSEPSTAKFAVTVVAPSALVVLAACRNPVRLLLSLAIISAPFDVAISYQGVAFSPLTICVSAAVVLTMFGASNGFDETGMVVAIPVAIALLAPAIVRAISPTHFGLLVGSMLAMGFLARRQAGEPGGLEFLLGSLVASAALQAGIAVWEFSTHNVLDLYGNSTQAKFASDYFFSFENADRPGAAFFDPISLGNVLAIALPIALALLLRSRTLTRRLLLVGAIGVISVALALTLSRMSWVGSVAGVVLVLCFLPGRRLRASLLVAATGGAALALALTLGGSALRDRFSSLSDPTSRTVATAAGDRTREALWNAAWHTAWRHELFGTGFGNLGVKLSRLVAGVGPQTHAHSTYLQLFAETGVVGLAAVVIVFSASLSGIWRGRLWQPTLASGLLGSLVAILVCWTTDYTARYIQVAVFMAVVIGAAAGVGGPERAGARVPGSPSDVA